MGTVHEKIVKRYFQPYESKILMMGIQQTGKTAILKYLRNKQFDSKTVPTIGFNVESVSLSNGVSYTLWDLGGQKPIRKLWHHYYQNTQAIVFVIDACSLFWNDTHNKSQKMQSKQKIEESKQELIRVLEEKSLSHAPVLILINKFDKVQVLGPAGEDGSISKCNDLDESIDKKIGRATKILLDEGEGEPLKQLLKHRKYKIFGVSAMTGHWIEQSFLWLSHMMINETQSVQN